MRLKAGSFGNVFYTATVWTYNAGLYVPPNRQYYTPNYCLLSFYREKSLVSLGHWLPSFHSKQCVDWTKRTILLLQASGDYLYLNTLLHNFQHLIALRDCLDAGRAAVFWFVSFASQRLCLYLKGLLSPCSSFYSSMIYPATLYYPILPCQ